MKNLSYLALASLAGCLLSSCETTSVTVATDYDRAARFGEYKTYALTPPKRGGTMSPTSEAALRDAVRAALNARGLVEAPIGKADLDIVRQVFVQQKTSVEEWTQWGYGPGGWPSGYGRYGVWAGAPTSYLDVQQYHEGTLVLDFVDRRTKKLVFRGIGQAVVEGPESNAGKIREAVDKIVSGYPSAASQ